MTLVRLFIAFLAATLCTYVLATMASTQFVLAELRALDVQVTLGDRLGMTLHDLLHMGATYLPLIGIGLLLAFSIAGVAVRILPGLRTPGFVLAGGLALWCMLTLMIMLFGLVPVAGARSGFGMLVQVLAGMVGGYVFVRVSDALMARGLERR